MRMIYEPNRIAATLKVVAIGEFYDDEASEETVRYWVEQDLEDAGFDVDVKLLKEKETLRPGIGIFHNEDGNKNYFLQCPFDGTMLDKSDRYCRKCGRAVKWND